MKGLLSESWIQVKHTVKIYCICGYSLVKCIYFFLKLSDPLQSNAVDRHHQTLSGLNNVTSLVTQIVFLALSLCFWDCIPWRQTQPKQRHGSGKSLKRSMVSHIYLHLQAFSKCFPKYGLIVLFLSICKAVILCQLTMLTSTSIYTAVLTFKAEVISVPSAATHFFRCQILANLTFFPFKN